MVFGEQHATMAGIHLMLMLFVDNWDFFHLVSLLTQKHNYFNQYSVTLFIRS